MAVMGQNSKTRWRRWAKGQKKMAAKGRWRGLTKEEVGLVESRRSCWVEDVVEAQLNMAGGVYLVRV